MFEFLYLSELNQLGFDSKSEIIIFILLEQYINITLYLMDSQNKLQSTTSSHIREFFKLQSQYQKSRNLTKIEEKYSGFEHQKIETYINKLELTNITKDNLDKYKLTRNRHKNIDKNLLTFKDQYYGKNEFPFVVKEFNESQKQKANAYFDQNLRPKKLLQTDYLQYQKQFQLQSPTQRLSELRIVKKNQILYRQDKQKFMDQNKKYRNIKNGWCSGILGIDNPYNDSTQLYKEEHQKIKKRLEHSMNLNKKNKLQVAYNHSTNVNIEVNNEWINRSMEKLKNDLNLGDNCLISKFNQTIMPVEWKSKQRVETNYQSKMNLSKLWKTSQFTPNIRVKTYILKNPITGLNTFFG